MAKFTCVQRPDKDEAWQPEQTPATRNVDGIQINLGEVTVQFGPFNAANDPLWDRTVVFPWQMMRNGVLLTNWSLQMNIRDSSGNADYFGARKSISNGWMYSRAWRLPDTRKVWKIQAQLAEDAGFAETNMFTIHLPVPMAGSFETNLGGYPFRIGFVNGDFVSTELLLTNRMDLRLNFLHAKDQAGHDINEGGGSWGQFSFLAEVQMPQPGGEVLATFAIGKNIPVEFMVKPRLLAPPPAKSEQQ